MYTPDALPLYIFTAGPLPGSPTATYDEGNPAMAFGQKVGSIKDLKQSLKKGTGTFIKYIPKEKDGTITVRFLDEPDEWVQYREVFDQVRRKSYPVPDEGMPGYPSPDARVSDRYLVNALDTENDKDRKSVV